MFENATAAKTCLVRGTGDQLSPGIPGRDLLRFAALLRPGWHAGFAATLVDRFQVPLGKQVKTLPQGKRCALGVTTGLASRATDDLRRVLPRHGRAVPYAFYDAFARNALPGVFAIGLGFVLVSPSEMVAGTTGIPFFQNAQEALRLPDGASVAAGLAGIVVGPLAIWGIVRDMPMRPRVA